MKDENTEPLSEEQKKGLREVHETLAYIFERRTVEDKRTDEEKAMANSYMMRCLFCSLYFFSIIPFHLLGIRVTN
jgi:hypothetical protein